MSTEELSGRLLGHYRLIRPLGQGGSATVYLSQDINLQREVAVKVFRARDEEAQEFLRRFAREARIVARLDHPHILPVYDYGEQGTLAYLVMPRMAGGSLRDRLREQSVLEPKEAVGLINQMLQALQYAHDRGLIHRDIKPGNMLFKADDTLLLSDFGLVKVLPTFTQVTLDEVNTVTGQAISGTPDYMAPEQIKGKAVPTSDIYSIGVVLYEMLTGTRPFKGDSLMALLLKQLNDPPVPPRVLNLRIAPDLEAVILRAMEKDAARRYQRADELASALIDALGNEDTAPMLPALPRSATGPRTPYHDPTRYAHSTDVPDGTVSPRAQENIILSATEPASPTTPIAQPDLAPVALPFQSGGERPASSLASPPYHPLRGRARSPLFLIGLLVALMVALTGFGILLLAPQLLGLHPEPAPAATVRAATPATTRAAQGTATLKGGLTLSGQAAGATPANAAAATSATTDCPPAGTVRAAILPRAGLGNDHNLIYIVNEGPSNAPTYGTVKRIDVNTNVKTEIKKMANTRISEAQVSYDGQWVLFTAQVSGQVELRLVRVDGQELQTLYCAPSASALFGAQWSYDQRSIVFDQAPANAPNQAITYLLDTGSGQLQQELLPSSTMSYQPRTWLDNTRVYMTGIVTSGPAQNIYILDTRKGPGQRDNSLQKVVTTSLNCEDFDSSYDLTQLITSSCTIGSGQGTRFSQGPSTITAQPATGGSASTIFTSPSLAVVAVRAVTRNTLLLLVENANGASGQNGVWRVNTDGSGLMHLSTDASGTQSLCSFSQYSWSNVSRDGSLYALQAYDQKTNRYSMLYGSLSGGDPTMFADISDGTQLFLAGWTDM